MSPRRSVVVALALALTQAGCSPGYLLQATAGQLEVIRARRPVAAVVADPATSPQVRAKLEVAGEILDFAHRDLALPDNGSYRQYADLGRPYVAWNVFAAPEFSLNLRHWCFPIAGCVAYRGYFAEEDAIAFARRLAARGDDVYVSGAAAYSTLGYFRDPLLANTLGLSDAALAGLVFHELAHQRLYVGGDTVFNESFATLVEQEGVVRWLAARGERAALCRYRDALAREAAVQQLLAEAGARLAAIYSAGGTAEDLRAAKAREIARLRAAYRGLRAGWQGPPDFDAIFDGTINNASLGALAAYDRLVGRLRVILQGEGGRLEAFYARAARLSQLDAADREEVLAIITTPSPLPQATCVLNP